MSISLRLHGLFPVFSRQEYWSGLPFPSPGYLPTKGSNQGLLHCRQTFYHLSYQGSSLGKEDIKKFLHDSNVISSVKFSHSVVSDSLQLHELQHFRPPCASPTPRIHPNPCPLSRWCHPTISSSVVLFSSCPQSFPESGSFQMSQLFASCGQSSGVSASISVLPMNTQDWSHLGWTGWMSLQSKGLKYYTKVDFSYWTT